MKYFSVAICVLIMSCTSNTVTNIEPIEPKTNTQIPPRQSPLKLTFAGDIMAHDVNFNMSDYSLIYQDVKELLLADDVSFANFETPVVDSLPNESYPTFNVNSSYALAAIEGGFDAFSLANNHTNDQGLFGILETRDFFDSLRPDGVYSAGIKRDDGLSYEVIKTQGWTILFAAITEIVNLYEHLDTFDMYSFTEKRKTDLLKDIKILQENNPNDIFVLSVHVADPEYDIRVSEYRQKWFYELLDAGVDIVWGNHPHVTKEWELIKSVAGDKLIMYSIGNTISGQNYFPAYDDPLHRYEDTGTSIFLHVDVKTKTIGSNYISTGVGEVTLTMNFTSTIIASHKDEDKNMVIKILDDAFISEQHKKNADYYTVRLHDMERIKGATIWR